MSLHIPNIRKNDYRESLSIKIQHWGSLFVLPIIILIFVLRYGCTEQHDPVDPVGARIGMVNDSTPPKKEVRASFELNYLYTNLDSINRFVFPHVGSQLSKDDWILIANLYKRIIDRLSSPKIDTISVKK